ncbi:hypothetical protein BTVI_03856 [Pitangus sulphuratus]|nr:hypothetical protein BTVI_03856 [Pitangus sulphuratus]
MPAGSRMDFLLLAKAKQISSNSNTSVITYLRTEYCYAEEIPAREEQSENMGTTRQTPRAVQKEGQEVLQEPEPRPCSPWCSHGGAAVPLQPREGHRGAETPLQPMEEPVLEQVDARRRL